MKITSCFFISFLLFLNIAFGQDNDIKIQLSKAALLEKESNYVEALKIRSFIDAKFNGSHSEWLMENRYKKHLNSFLVKNDSASIVEITKAVSVFEKLKMQPADEKIRLYSYLYQRQYDNYLDMPSIATAIKLYEYLLKINRPQDRQAVYKTLNFISGTYALIGNSVESQNYLLKLLPVAQQIYGPDSEQTAQVFISMASVSSAQDNFAAQVKAMDSALKIFRKKEPQNKFLLFNLYNFYVLSYVYYGDLEKASEYLKLLNSYYEKNKGYKSFINYESGEYKNLNHIKTTLQIANVVFYKANGDSENLSRHFNIFNAGIDKNKTDYTDYEIRAINDIYIQMAVYYTTKEPNYQKAVGFYDKVLPVNKNNKNGNGTVSVLHYKGWTNVCFEKWQQAVSCFEQALKYPEAENFIEIISLHQYLGTSYYHLRNFAKADFHINHVMRFYASQESTYQGIGTVENFYRIGEIYVDIYKKNKQKAMLYKAYEAFKKSSGVFSKVYQGGVFNDQLSNIVNKINSGLLFCSDNLKQKTEEALELVEKNNSSFVWSNFLLKQENAFKVPKQLHDSLLHLQQKNSQMKQLAAVSKENPQKNHEQELAANQKKIRSLEKLLKDKYPSFSDFSNPHSSISAIRAKLMHDERIISYKVFDTVIYAFEITKQQTRLQKLDVKTDALKKSVSIHLVAMKQPAGNAASSAKKLYQELINPLKVQKQEKLIFITDDFLAYLPFETLMNSDGYLVAENSISYSSSLKLWEIQKQNINPDNKSIAAFSPEYDLKLSGKSPDIALLARSGNFELKGAQTEAKKIVTLFNGDLFSSASATRKNFIANASGYRILHLAMHAVVDENDSNKSSLIFSNGEKLYVSEFYDLRIPAEMAVLSACNTGYGNLKNGEGIISMSRAFTYAGVRSTVMSLWQVPDAETSEIMISFYGNLKSGQDKDVALANAKRDFINKNPMKSHPFFWAGFVVNGNVSAISENECNGIYFALIAVLAVVGTLWVFRRKLFQRFQ